VMPYGWEGKRSLASHWFSTYGSRPRKGK